MPVQELFRQDQTLLKSASGADTRQVPAGSATLDLYWKGARVSVGSTGTVGHIIAVYDPGTIGVGDTVAKNGIGTTGAVTAVTATTITVTWGAAVTVVTGDRIVILSRSGGATRPVAYSDPQGTVSLGSQVTTNSSGLASFYTLPRDIDMVATVDAVTQVLADQAGQGDGSGLVFDFGMTADGVTDDAAALNRLLAYVLLKGKRDLVLPPATIQVNSAIVISTSVVLRGAGRGATRLQGTAGINVLQLSAADCVVENLTVQRSAAAGAGSRLIWLDAQRTTLRGLGLRDGAVGVYDESSDATLDDVICTGSGWESFYYGRGAVAPQLYAFRGASDSNISAANAAIRLDSVVQGRFVGVTVTPTTGRTMPALQIEQTGAVPRELVFMGCRFAGSSGATATDECIEILAGKGLRFIGCDLVDALSGYHVNGAAVADVQIMGGSVIAMRQNGVDIDAGSQVHIVELLSSDNNLAALADNRADHVNIAAGVSNISVIGLTVGRLVIGGGPLARAGVSIEAGAGAGIQVMGVRGLVTDLTVGWVRNNSTSQELDIGHNVELGNNRAYTHTATPGAEAMGGLVGTKTVSDASTTTDVRNVDTVILNQSAGATWTNLTFGREGQVVKIVNVSAVFSATFQSASLSFTLLGGTDAVLGLGDTLTLMNAGGLWYEMARSNNAP